MSRHCPLPWCPRKAGSDMIMSPNMIMSMVICTFKMLDDDTAEISTKNVSRKIGITADLKQAFTIFKEDYKTDVVPDHGMAVVVGGNPSNAKVAAYFPFNFDEHLSQDQALALYTQWFEQL